MWAEPAQLTGPSKGTFGWADLDPTYPFPFFRLGRTQWSGLGPHGCWPDPTTMQINKAACRTNSRSACINSVAATVGWRYLTLECLNGGLAGRDEERPTWGLWLRLWRSWWCCCRYWRRKKTKMVVLVGCCRCGGKGEAVSGEG